jgi:hypothetical protein
VERVEKCVCSIWGNKNAFGKCVGAHPPVGELSTGRFLPHEKTGGQKGLFKKNSLSGDHFPARAQHFALKIPAGKWGI